LKDAVSDAGSLNGDQILGGRWSRIVQKTVIVNTEMRKHDEEVGVWGKNEISEIGQLLELWLLVLKM